MRGGVRSRAGCPGRGARRAARFRKHVGGERAVRARTRHGARAAGGRRLAPCPADRSRPRLQRRVRPAEPRPMMVLYAILLFVVAQRGAELILVARNTRRLRAAGAVEIDAASYPLFVMLHGGWLAAMAIAIPADAAPLWPLIGVFVLLQLGRVWVIATLGRRWTTRIIVLPHTKPVTSGPYRWCRHPNYLVVAGEIAVLPLAFGAVSIAAIFSLLNAALLTRRILIETAALRTGITSSQSAALVPGLCDG